MQFLKVSVFTVVLAGCSTANVPAARPPAESTQPATQRNPVETALVEAAGVQYGAYAELLGMLSNEGATPLLSLQVDLGAAAPDWAMANYRRLIELTDRMVVAEAEFQQAIKVLSEQTGLPAPGKAAAPNSVGWNLQLLSLLPAMQTGLLQTDLLHSGWKFWKWGENSRRRARATVLGVVFADAEKHQLQKPEQEMMRRHVYEVARKRYSDRANVGRSEREFYENLRDGKLDHIAQRLHADMSHDASEAGMSYLTITGVQGERPIDIVYKEGCRGLAAGVDLYVAAGKAAVAGGLGPEAGKKFTEGFDKGVEIVEKIQEVETRVEQFREVVRDPIGYAQDKAPKVIQQRAVELLKDKTGLSDKVIEECTDQLGEAVQQMVQNTEVSRRIDEAYQRDQFLAELAKERGDQPAPGESMPQGPAGEAIRLRRITEQVHEEMAADGWNLNTLRIDLGEAANALHDTARSSLDSMVAWWNDAQAGATRLTILPTPVASGTAVALPGGVRTELIELADSGTIHRLTDRPVVVSREGVTQVAIRPLAIEPPASGIAVRDGRTSGQQPGNSMPIQRAEDDYTIHVSVKTAAFTIHPHTGTWEMNAVLLHQTRQLETVDKIRRVNIQQAIDLENGSLDYCLEVRARASGTIDINTGRLQGELISESCQDKITLNGTALPGRQKFSYTLDDDGRYSWAGMVYPGGVQRARHAMGLPAQPGGFSGRVRGKLDLERGGGQVEFSIVGFDASSWSQPPGSCVGVAFKLPQGRVAPALRRYVSHVALGLYPTVDEAKRAVMNSPQRIAIGDQTVWHRARFQTRVGRLLITGIGRGNLNEEVIRQQVDYVLDSLRKTSLAKAVKSESL